MKRWIALLLAAILVLSLAPAALALTPTGYAIIKADIPTDRLNLRKAPSADSDSLGRYYIGTRVRMTGESGEYTKVEIGEGEGAATGYMLTKYLIPETKDANYILDIFSARTKSAGELLDSPRSSGRVIDTYSKNDTCIILGDVGDDWRHVILHGLYGYVRASRLHPKTAYVWRANLDGGDSGVVTLYEGQSLSSRIVGQFINDTGVEVNDIDKNGWAHVSISGTNAFMPGDLEGLSFSGYVLNKCLNINDRTLSERVPHRAYDLPVMTAKRDIASDEIKGLENAFFRVGTAFAAVGYTRDNRVIAQFDNHLISLPPDVAAPTDRFVTHYDLPIIGYGFVLPEDVGGSVALLYPSDNSETLITNAFTNGECINIVAKAGDFYQLKYFAGFVPAERVRYYDIAQLYSGMSTFVPGTYVVGTDIKSALYTVHSGRAVVSLGDKEKTYESIDECTFYLPAGATLTVESGLVAPAQQRLILTQNNEFVSNLSGRYLAGTQMVTQQLWEYHVTAAEGADDAYYVVSTLINDDLSQDYAREEMRVNLEPNETYLLTLYDSEFVEFHHCDIEVFYGNG